MRHELHSRGSDREQLKGLPGRLKRRERLRTRRHASFSLVVEENETCKGLGCRKLNRSEFPLETRTVSFQQAVVEEWLATMLLLSTVNADVEER
jgi:hypothetical protein